MPVNPKDFEYVFVPGVLVEIRERLGLSQASLSKLLSVPTNTISRWEREDTTPDANSLAAFYSIAKGAKLEPEFFRRRLRLDQNMTELVESEFLNVLKETDGKPVLRTELGQRLKEILENRGATPEVVGLSKNRSLHSLLKRLEDQKKVRIREVAGGSGSISVELVGSSNKGATDNRRTRYFTIARKGRASYELTVVGKDGRVHKLDRDKKGKDGHFTDEGQYRRAIEKAQKENSR